MYENDLTPIIEETLTMPFFLIKSNCSKNAYIFTGEKGAKELNHNPEQLIEFIEKI